MSTKPRDESVELRVEHYFAVLARCIDQCAEHRVGNVDVFLWNARRVVEAVLYALAVGTETDPFTRKEEPDLHQLANELSKAGRLPAHVMHQLELIRKLGNIGAHTQHPKRAATPPDVDACRRNFSAPVRWAYAEVNLAPSIPPEVERAIRDLESDGPRIPEREHKAKLTAQLLENEMTITQLKEKLRAAVSAEPERQLDVPAAARARNDWWVRSACLVLGAIVGIAVGVTVVPGTSSSSEAMLAPVVPEPVAVAIEAVDAGRDADVIDDAGAARPLATPPALSCPDGYVLVPSGSLALSRGPFPRAEWPQPDVALAPIEVGAFCIAPQPVTTSEYAACVDAGACPAIRGCNFVDSTAGGLAANCTRETDAEALCTSRGSRVASVAEWERAVRGVRDQLHLLTGTDEWARDAFPPAIFGYSDGARTGSGAHVFHSRLVGDAPDGSPMLSWSRRADDAERLRSLSFRCTVDPR